MTDPQDVNMIMLGTRISLRVAKAMKKKKRKHETASEYLRRLVEADCADLLQPKDSPRG